MAQPTRRRGVSTTLDHFQRRHAWAGLPIAVVYKFVDDQGSYLAALVTYYALLSLFPLFLIVASVLGFVLHGNQHLQKDVLGSALAQFPIVGQQIQSNLGEYTGSGTAVIIGIIGATWGGLGVAQAGQNAMNIIWAVPRRARPNPIKSRLRSLGLLVSLGTAILVSTALAAFSSDTQTYGVDLGPVGRWGALAVAVAVNIVTFVGAYRLLTVKDVTTRQVLPGAVLAALLWQTLQSLGTFYVAHKLRGAQEVYGVFGLVLGLIAWIYFEALIVVLCGELNAVRARHLWPRALLTPFTDDVDLTGADQQAYGSYARAQQFKRREHIDVVFRPEEEEPVREPGPPPAHRSPRP